MSVQLAVEASNYYSNELGWEYLSNSQLKDFETCEACARAKLTGEWVEEPREALTVGNYVHSAMESEEAHTSFLEANKGTIYNSKGKPYAAYVQADKMIETLRNDPFAMDYYTGAKEHIVIADYLGATWKAKLDVVNTDERRIVDLKTCKGIHEKAWIAGVGYVPWVVAYQYTRQLALYAELYRIATNDDTWFEPFIVAVSKEDIPDKAVISLGFETVQNELEGLKYSVDRVLQVKGGYAEPHRCEQCKFCRASKKLNSVIYFMDLTV